MSAEAVSLWDGLPPEEALIPPDPDLTIQERFELYHAANGWVFDALVRLADDWKRQGQTRVGIKLLIEVVRWHYLRSTTATDFKVNNDFSSRYARLICERRPDLADLFELRALRAA